MDSRLWSGALSVSDHAAVYEFSTSPSYYLQHSSNDLDTLRDWIPILGQDTFTLGLYSRFWVWVRLWP